MSVASAEALRLAELLRGAERAVVLTGAGISVPSGIPDFRTPGKGLWEKVNPMEVGATPTASGASTPNASPPWSIASPIRPTRQSPS